VRLECEWLHPKDKSDLKGGLMKSGKYESSESGGAGMAVTFLLIGLGAGALVGLLLAPKTGKQMRKELRKRYDGALDAFEDLREEVRDRAEEALERGAEIAEDLRGVARDKVGPLGRALRRD
jgi:hypothetical protein